MGVALLAEEVVADPIARAVQFSRGVWHLARVIVPIREIASSASINAIVNINLAWVIDP
jgi:hypothetical protein